jgi:ankyrin repeat protein
MYDSKNGMTHVVKKILNKNNCDLYYINYDNSDNEMYHNTALSYAIKNNNINIIRLLIQKGCDFYYYHKNLGFIPDKIIELDLVKDIENELLNMKIFDNLFIFIDFLNTFNIYKTKYDHIDILDSTKNNLIYYDNVLNNVIRKEEKFKFVFKNKRDLLFFICKNALHLKLIKTAKRIISMLSIFFIEDLKKNDKNGYSLLHHVYNTNNKKLIKFIEQKIKNKKEEMQNKCYICLDEDKNHFLTCSICKNTFHNKCFWNFYNISGSIKCLLCLSKNTFI